MVSSWPKFASQCKSRLSAIARSCFLRRKHWFRKFKKAEQLLKTLRADVASREVHCKQLEEENRQLRERVAELEAKLAEPQAVKLPLGEVPAGQQYGEGVIALCVNLATKIGLRPTVRALEIISDWLRAVIEIPTFQTIRTWMQRIGLFRLLNAEKIEGGTWLVDHTNQIGREKVLTILRVQDSKMPRPGVPLRHEDVEVLALVPGEQWKREDVTASYKETEQRCGTPRAVASDGAVELREPSELLGKSRKKPLVIRDLKHFLANKLEALLNQDPQFEAFTKKLGGIRSALQQTELAHFIPPTFKLKSRFMNLAPILRWALMILWHLDHPHSQSRKGIRESRMTEKLGWVRDFAQSIRRWQECQDVISTALTFINKQGIFRGVVKQLQHLAKELTTCRMSQKLASKTIELLREYEMKLQPNERLPMSTEILESSFSLYKQLEKQHSKSGFTSLILTFPTLLRATTPGEVKQCFAQVKVADVKEWTKKHLPDTLASKRQRAFREAKTKTKKKRQNSATPLQAAA